MSSPADERRRVATHLSRVLRALRRSTPAGLSDRQRARRRDALRALADYITAGRFPLNRVSAARTPVFVDADGARCAMAALLESTGDDALVRRVARDHNLAAVAQLRGDPEFGAWLARNGITASEAAVIQPAYHAYEEARWQATVSVIASATGGASTDTGAQFALAPTLRLGVRRVIRGSTDSGHSVYGSLALTAEYARSIVLGLGATHHVGLTLQWEPDGNTSDIQWYLLGGPLASIDDDDAPGTAFGGQLGAGFNFRTRAVPLLFEGVVQGLGQAGGATLRAGVQVGVVW